MLRVGDTVERYVIEDQLGGGGGGVVFLVRHQTLDSLFALKVPHQQTGTAAKRLMMEGRIQAAVRHPNIVSVFDVVQIADRCGLLLEYVHGPSLDRALRTTRLSFREVDALARQILAGVAAAHALNLIHRDLKPANVLLDRVDGMVRARVADFGIGRALGDGGGVGTQTGAVMGSLDYMPIEQIRSSSRADARSDVYALGSMLYELLTGEAPIVAENVLDRFERLENNRWTPLSERAAHLPSRMIRAVDAALQVAPERRPRDAAALRDLWADGTPAPTPVRWSDDQFSALFGRAATPPRATVADRRPITPADPARAAHPPATNVAPWSVSEATTGEGPYPPAAAPAWSMRPGVAQPLALERSDPPSIDAASRPTPSRLRRSALWVTVACVALLGAGWWATTRWENDPSFDVGAPEEQDDRGAQPADGVVLEGLPLGAPTAPELRVEPPASPAPALRAPLPAVTSAKPEPGPPAAPAAPAVADRAPPPPPASSAPRGPPPVNASAAGPQEAPRTRWSVSGAERAYLVDDAGQSFPPGDVPTGRYRLRVVFPGDAHATTVRAVALSEGAALRLRCDAMLRTCQ